jgi:hypothetical protein
LRTPRRGNNSNLARPSFHLCGVGQAAIGGGAGAADVLNLVRGKGRGGLAFFPVEDRPVWVKVRAIGSQGPVPWSDPATKIVP